MFVYNIGFINSDGKDDVTQLDIEEQDNEYKEVLELMNLILSLKDEMDIKEITYIECVNQEEAEE